MASPITTGGFAVQERLAPQYADPRSLVPNYGGIIPGISQGLGAAGQFAQIVEDAQQRPIRRQLAQIQLDEAKARLAMLPVEQQIAALRLGEAKQQAAIPEFVTEGTEIVGGEPRLGVKDINAGFGNLEFTQEFTPRERITRGQRIGAGGIVSPFEKRETLLTGRQIQFEEDKAASIADARLRAAQVAEARATTLAEAAKAKAETDRIRADNDRIKADAAMMRAQDLRSNPNYEESAVTQDENGNVVLNFVNKKTMERVAIPTNQARSATSNFFFGGARPAAAASAVPGIDPDIAALAEGLGNKGSSPKATPKTSFATTEEAEAYKLANPNLLKDGTKITVGGKPATWRD